jgi:hypothetical protein
MQARHCCRLKWAAVATAAGSSHHNPTRRKKLLEKQKFNGVSRAEAGTRRKNELSSVQLSLWEDKRELDQEREREICEVLVAMACLFCFALLAEELELPAAPFISSATIHDNNYGCIIIINTIKNFNCNFCI